MNLVRHLGKRHLTQALRTTQECFQGAARGEWALIDFYADWCVNCHVIELNVFGDPDVATRLEHLDAAGVS